MRSLSAFIMCVTGAVASDGNLPPDGSNKYETVAESSAFVDESRVSLTAIERLRLRSESGEGSDNEYMISYVGTHFPAGCAENGWTGNSWPGIAQRDDEKGASELPCVSFDSHASVNPSSPISKGTAAGKDSHYTIRCCMETLTIDPDTLPAPHPEKQAELDAFEAILNAKDIPELIIYYRNIYEQVKPLKTTLHAFYALKYLEIRGCSNDLYNLHKNPRIFGVCDEVLRQALMDYLILDYVMQREDCFCLPDAKSSHAAN